MHRVPIFGCLSIKYHVYKVLESKSPRIDSISLNLFAMPHAASPNIVTYRLDKKMVYVTPADSYEQAVDFAREVFADELSGVEDLRVCFAVTVEVQRATHTVQIGPMAWTAVVATLVPYEIIDVTIQPKLGHADDTLLPPYTAADLKDAKCSWSRSPSPSSRPHTPISRSRSPNSAKGARSWLEKHFQS